jgi:putative aminopeptidase FrvX
VKIKEILREYMLLPAPSGYEAEMAYRMKDDLALYCDATRLDRAGNCIGKINGRRAGLPVVMVFGHMDQLGFIVRRIDDKGFIQVDRLGGIPEKVLPGLSVILRGENGVWYSGVFGTKSHHAMSQEEKYNVERVTELYIDIGARSKEEVEGLSIHVGCPVIYKPSFSELHGDRITGTAVDNRGACACLVGIAKLLNQKRPDCDVYIVGTVWEEFNLRGAMLAARTIKPDIAISLDVTLAGDTHDLSAHFEDTLGGGPCVQLYSFHGRGTLNGTLPHAPLFKSVKETAARLCCPLQRFAALGILTDTAYIQLEGEGVACLEMGFPARYTHTPNEVCDVNDIAALSVLVAEVVLDIDENFQLNRL